MNNLNKKEEINKKEIDKKEIDKKEWKDFKSNYTFLMIALLIYSLRPLTINRNNEELSYMLEIINKKLTKENYKEELNLIIRMITSTFIKISSINREQIIEKKSTKRKILDIIKHLLNINSYHLFYSKMIEYDSSVTNNKDFFNFIASLITFGDIKNSLNSETRNHYITYLIKRVSNSPLNKLVSKMSNQNNIVINNQIKNYKNILINISSNFFKNMVKNNSVRIINSKVLLKNNIHVNTSKSPHQLNNKQSEVISGGSINKSKNKSFVKNMWWLKKYKS